MATCILPEDPSALYSPDDYVVKTPGASGRADPSMDYIGTMNRIIGVYFG